MKPEIERLKRIIERSYESRGDEYKKQFPYAAMGLDGDVCMRINQNGEGRCGMAGKSI